MCELFQHALKESRNLIKGGNGAKLVGCGLDVLLLLELGQEESR